MRKKCLVWLLVFVITSIDVIAQTTSEPWKPSQLITTESLANSITHPSPHPPLVINIGPAGLIKSAIDIGSTNKKENLTRLEEVISKEPKDREIVLYCGCCPFKNCPNIRPAFSLLNTMKFINSKLLDIPKNLKVDWIDHGYPMEKN